MLDSILAASTNAAKLILAQATSAPAPNGGGSGIPQIPPILLIVVIIGIFYFVMFRDQRKKQGTRKQMLANMKKGDKVLTIGGVLGTIVGIKDDEVVIKVDEASNTKITFVRSAVDRVISEQESKQLMMYALPIQTAARKGLRRCGKQPGPCVAARWLGVILALALFSVDTFQPIIGLVEVSKTPDKANSDAQPNPDSKPAQVPQPVVVSIHAWQWNQPNGELWPAFVFLPTISAGSGRTTRSSGSAVSQGGPAALMPLPLVLSPPAPLSLAYLAQLPNQSPALQLSWCRQICPMGPPSA